MHIFIIWIIVEILARGEYLMTVEEPFVLVLLEEAYFLWSEELEMLQKASRID